MSTVRSASSTVAPYVPRFVIDAQDVLRGRHELMNPRDARWERRWPFMNVITGCGYLPLKAKTLEVDMSTYRAQVVEKGEKLLQHKLGHVISNEGALRTIVSFL